MPVLDDRDRISASASRRWTQRATARRNSCQSTVIQSHAVNHSVTLSINRHTVTRCQSLCHAVNQQAHCHTLLITQSRCQSTGIQSHAVNHSVTLSINRHTVTRCQSLCHAVNQQAHWHALSITQSRCQSTGTLSINQQHKTVMASKIKCPT